MVVPSNMFAEVASCIGQEPEVYRFGENIIDKRQVFFSTDMSFALVNIRPVVPGEFHSSNLIDIFPAFFSASD